MRPTFLCQLREKPIHTAGWIALLTFTGFSSLAVSANNEQSIKDPTRPYFSITEDGAVNGYVGNANSSEPVLQSVMMSNRQQSAIISGTRVVVGGRFGDYRLLSVSETKAVLRSADNTLLTLSMPHAAINVVRGRSGKSINTK